MKKTKVLLANIFVAKYFLIGLFGGMICGLNAQVAINTTGNAPDPSAMLDVNSNQHGILIPRMTAVERDCLKTPAIGLLIYNTTTNTLNIYTNSGWYALESIPVGSITGSTAPGGGIAVNEDGSNPANVAILDVKSSVRGFLLPRTLTSSISSLSQGLIIYNTSTNRITYYDGSSWQTPCHSFSSNITGSGTLSPVGVSITETGNAPDQSSIFEVQSTNKGLLIPRLSDANRNSLSPVQGLILYNTTTNKLNYWSSTTWQEVLSSAPATPGTIAGPSSICQGQSGVTYSISSVPGATSYTWTVPSDATITAGQGTTSITVTFGNISGNITVVANNACGSSGASTLAVTVNTLSTAATSASASPATVCPGCSSTLTVNGGTLGTGASWYWYSGSCGGTAVGTGASNFEVLHPLQTHYVRAEGTCNTTACVSVTVTVGPSCGTQVWMTANMNVGTMVNSIYTGYYHSDQTNDNVVEKYCYNNVAANCATYGGLYEWTEAIQVSVSYGNTLYGTASWMTCDPCGSGGRQGICPAGYHVPTDLEFSRYEWCVENNIAPAGSTPLSTFQTGEGYRGSNSAAGPGHKMKASSSNTPSWDGSNASGFTALPAGIRRGVGSFDVIGVDAHFWTATEYNATDAWFHQLYSNYFQSRRIEGNKRYGFSVRCIQN